jgi:hypothetical protein
MKEKKLETFQTEQKQFGNIKRKSHNQKIHDAHVLRTQEKEAAKQVSLFCFL